MSTKHATISAWQRREDGSYVTEMNGWTLRVRWRPESRHERRGFLWTAQRPGTKLAATEIHEEIEVAMAEAEEAAGPPPAARHDEEAAHH